MTDLTSPRFTTQAGHLISIEVPEEAAQTVLSAVLAHDALEYGDYDQVAFQTAQGSQQFRSLGTGHNAETARAVTVPCLTLSFFTALANDALSKLVEAVYHAHPYEEAVVYISQTTRTLHVRGVGDDSPHKFWNRNTPDWVPAEHRKG